MGAPAHDLDADGVSLTRGFRHDRRKRSQFRWPRRSGEPNDAGSAAKPVGQPSAQRRRALPPIERLKRQGKCKATDPLGRSLVPQNRPPAARKTHIAASLHGIE